ncbi:Diaminopropionate ammonia-lyase [Lasiodiplodia hormozganensis]|uniref:Diaminopropionate ammonia-lyase n=1 Tax=Lasiodiplodia hormozganensis TaxID=869390 RepID=A0AA39YUG8_9PEZI|nr:Diaminopropionate ammonia-lyase [Lasiodiplodia hormozganensis]
MSPTSSDSPTCWLRTSAAVSACQPSRFWVPPGPFIGPPQRNAKLPLTVPLQELEDSTGLRFVTCTDGNWGRAVARMAKYLSVPAHVFVPQNVDQTTRDNIKSEGAEVPVVQGGYDSAIGAVREDAEAATDSWSWILRGPATTTFQPG